MSTDSIVTLSGTIITVLFAAFHLSGRITALETKVELMMRKFMREVENNGGD